LSNVVVEDSQTGVVRQTSVDCSEPVNSLVFVHLVACRVELKCVVTAICNVMFNKYITLLYVKIVSLDFISYRRPFAFAINDFNDNDPTGVITALNIQKTRMIWLPGVKIFKVRLR